MAIIDCYMTAFSLAEAALVMIVIWCLIRSRQIEVEIDSYRQNRRISFDPTRRLVFWQWCWNDLC